MDDSVENRLFGSNRHFWLPEPLATFLALKVSGDHMYRRVKNYMFVADKVWTGIQV